MEKSTTELLNALNNCDEFRDYYADNKKYFIDKSLAEYLNDLVKEKKLRKCDIFRDADMSEVYGYQVLSGLRTPKREKLLAIALAMKLSLEETQQLLKIGSYSQLYVKIPFDCVVIYGICNKLDAVNVNALLFQYDLGSL